MKYFDVYKHPIQGYEAIKRGFSWPAFLFTVFWAFVKKMWGLGFAFIGVILILSFGVLIFTQDEFGDGDVFMWLVQLVFYVVVGVKGNEWRRDNLVKRGFDRLDTVAAETPDAAIAVVAKSSSTQRTEST